MHPNPIFHSHSAQANLAFARKMGFGVLAVAAAGAGDGAGGGAGAPHLSHVPFVLDDDGTAWLHLVRSNPIARALTTPLPAKIAVSGPDAYISPDWYGVPDQVPTWNYVAVHLTGTLGLLPQADLPALLHRQSQHFEARLAPKPPWLPDKMTPETLTGMMRQIVPCRFDCTKIDGTWKLSQNKPDAVRHAAAAALGASGTDPGAKAMADLMRAPPTRGA